MKIKSIVFVSLLSILFGVAYHDAFGFSYDYIDSLLEKNEFDQALVYLDGILEENPNHRDSLFYKGYVLDEMGRYDEALENYDKVLDDWPNDFETLYNMAVTLEHLGEYGAAIQYYDRVLAIHPNDVDSLFYKGVLLYDRGSYHESKSLFEKILKIKPNDVDARVYIEKNNQQINQELPFSGIQTDRGDKGFEDRQVGSSDDSQVKGFVDDIIESMADNSIVLGGIGIAITIIVYWYFFKTRSRV